MTDLLLLAGTLAVFALLALLARLLDGPDAP